MKARPDVAGGVRAFNTCRDELAEHRVVLPETPPNTPVEGRIGGLCPIHQDVVCLCTYLASDWLVTWSLLDFWYWRRRQRQRLAAGGDR